MKQLEEDLRERLLAMVDSLVGFADLTTLGWDGMNRGVSVAVALPKEVVRSIQHGPTRSYFESYHRLNAQLDRLVTAGADFLRQKGFRAFAQTTDVVTETEDYRTRLPHKTVATRAGLGWIGKSALLVTPEYGPAVRLSSLLTDAPLDCAEPVVHSQCGNCTACADACPGKAITGELWEPRKDRETFFHALKCRSAARKLAAETIYEEITLCGQCIFVCPYARRYYLE